MKLRIFWIILELEDNEINYDFWNFKNNSVNYDFKDISVI